MPLVSSMRLSRWLVAVLLTLGCSAAAPACTIPVFRYALERWELSAYEVVVFHRGELPRETRMALDTLTGKANVNVTTVDVDGKLSPAMKKLWDRYSGTAKLPWTVLRRADAPTKAAWSGPLDLPLLRKLIDSPARQKMVTAFSQGDAAVFLVLQSDKRDADDAVEKLLRRELTKFEKLVKLPEQRGEGPRIRLALPLKVSFTVLPLSREDAAEDGLVKLLLGTEDDLPRVDGPIVFPIFGRGRVLGSMYGKDLEADAIFDVVTFLCGECSCQVKDMNPGTDLPIAADWAAIFEKIGPAPETGPEAPLGITKNAARVKPITSLPEEMTGYSKAADFASVIAVSHYPDTSDVLPASPRATVDPPPPAMCYRCWLWTATLAASLLVLVTGGWLAVVWLRSSR